MVSRCLNVAFESARHATVPSWILPWSRRGLPMRLFVYVECSTVIVAIGQAVDRSVAEREGLRVSLCRRAGSPRVPSTSF